MQSGRTEPRKGRRRTMKIYSKQDVEIIFTEKVQEYMNMGYRLNIGTMGGSQGEVGKVDLTDGANEIVRIRLETGMLKGTWTTGAIIYIESFGMDVQDNNSFNCFDHLWNGQGEEIERIEFVEVQSGDRYNSVKYITREDYDNNRVQEIREERMMRSAGDDADSRVLKKYDSKVVLGILRRVKGLGTCKEEDIERVQNVSDLSGGRRYYIGIAHHRVRGVYVSAFETSPSRY